MARKYSETRKWLKPVTENGEVVDHNEVEVTIEFDWVDNGIGGYEYWGSKGTHTQWQAEITSVKDVDGNEIFDQIEDDQIVEWENSIEDEPDSDDDYGPMEYED